MTHTSESLQSTPNCCIFKIEVGNSSHLDVQGLGIVQLDDGCINNVFLVPKISTILLSIYEICHSKQLSFLPIMWLRDLQDPDTIVSYR